MPLCHVSGCSVNIKKGVVGHRFPYKKNLAVARRWLVLCKIEFRSLASFNSFEFDGRYICGKHFHPEDYNVSAAKRRLKDDAIPSLHMPSNPTLPTSTLKKGRQNARLEKRKRSSSPSITITISDSSSQRLAMADEPISLSFNQCQQTICNKMKAPVYLHPFCKHSGGFFSSFDNYRRSQRKNKVCKYRQRHLDTHHCKYPHLQGNFFNIKSLNKSLCQDYYHSILRSLLEQKQEWNPKCIEETTPNDNQVDDRHTHMKKAVSAEENNRRIIMDHAYARNLVEEKTILKCAYCGKVVFMELLQDHMRVEHNGLTTKCFICNKEYFFGESLLQHIKVIHKLDCGTLDKSHLAYEVVKKHYVWKKDTDKAFDFESYTEAEKGYVVKKNTESYSCTEEEKHKVVKEDTDKEVEPDIYTKEHVTKPSATPDPSQLEVDDQDHTGLSNVVHSKRKVTESNHNEVACYICNKKFRGAQKLIEHLIEEPPYAFKSPTSGQTYFLHRIKSKASQHENKNSEISVSDSLTTKHACSETGSQIDMIVNRLDADTISVLELSLMGDSEPKPKDCSTHSQRIKYKCKICLKVFKNVKLHLLHQANAHKDESNTEMCIFCGQLMATKGEVYQHYDDAHSDKSICCPECIYTCYTHGNMKRHIKRNHPDVVEKMPAHKCNICNEVFPDYLELKQHRYVKHPETVHKCSQCDRIYLKLTAYERHKKLHNLNLPSHICSFCGEMFSKVRLYHLHKMEAHPDTCYKCSFCGKQFLNKQPCHRHEESHVSKIKREHRKCLKCRKCKEIFLSRIGLQKHTCRKDTQGKIKRVHRRCRKCKKLFLSRIELREHTENAHSKIKCDTCGREVHKNLFKQHILRHTEKKNFLCTVCGARFYTTGELNHHRKKTHEDKPRQLNKCDRCGKEYANKSTLEVHVKKHDGTYKNKTEPCQFCGKLVSSKTALRDHIRIHTGEKPHKCRICEKAFAKSCNMRDHEKIHSGTQRKRQYKRSKEATYSNGTAST